MSLQIAFSEHARRKLEEREMDQVAVEKVLREPKFIFYDLLSKTTIAIAEVEIAGIRTNLVIPYIKELDMVRIVSVYPCKDIAREIKKKEGVRWVRVK